MDPVNKSNPLVNLLRNTLIVAVTFVLAEFVFHSLFSLPKGNYIPEITTLWGYLLLFSVSYAHLYDKVSALWRSGSTNAFVNSSNEDAFISKVTMNKVINSAVFGILVFLGVRAIRVVGALTGFEDVDAPGIEDVADAATVILVNLALESGGKTESDNDDKDKVPPKTTSPGGGG